MKEIDIQIASILSHRTKLGMVELQITEVNEDGFPAQQIKTQFDIRKAREIRDMLSESIEAAISDTIIYKFMHERVGLDEERASMALLDFRQLRQGSKGTVYPT
jgi:hypothetical protein